MVFDHEIGYQLNDLCQSIINKFILNDTSDKNDSSCETLLFFFRKLETFWAELTGSYRKDTNSIGMITFILLISNL